MKNSENQNIAKATKLILKEIASLDKLSTALEKKPETKANIRAQEELFVKLEHLSVVVSDLKAFKKIKLGSKL